MSDQPLHPNLARLAAAYDEITQRFARGQVSAAEANSEIMALVARDDEGVHWSIDPHSGGWLRRTRTGDLVPGTPPSYGVATPTAHDLTRNSDAFNPDSQVTFHAVDESLLYAPGSLAGSTRTPPSVPSSSRLDQLLPTTKHRVAAAVAAVLLLAAGWSALGGGDDTGEPLAPGDTPASDVAPADLPVDTPAPPAEPAPAAPVPGEPAPVDPGA